MWGDAVNARVNRQLIHTTRFDSGALGLLAVLLRQFPVPGRYRVAVSQKGQPSADVSFVVDDNAEVGQLDIDLAQAVRDATARPDACDCPPAASPPTSVVSPKGYVLFHTSAGDGYSVVVTDAAGKVVFDSTKLGNGDLFAVSLLEPAVYAMANRLGNAAGEAAVKLPPEGEKLRTLETRHIDVTEKGFNQDRVDLISTQGLVFRVGTAARIVIEKRHSAVSEDRKPFARWQKLPVDGGR